MAEPFSDFFRDLPDCLDPQRTRVENYKCLRKRLDRVRNQHTQDAWSEQALLNRAMSVFKDEESYGDWRKKWEANARGRSKHDGEDEASRRKAEMAHERARKAEEAQRREAERARALERELEEAKLRAAQAEREKEEAGATSKRPLWAEIGLKVIDHLLSDAKRPASVSSNLTPNSLEPASIDLTGDWIADDGTWVSFWQNGGQIRVQVKDIQGQIVSEGHGQFDGRQFRIQFQTVPMLTPMGFIPTVGEAWGQVSRDGRFIRGQGVNQTLGQTFQTSLRRPR